MEQDNYSALPARLREARFAGWIPDLAGLQRGRDAFDALGFARDGSHWVAFNYKPLPSAFWPTNGSTDDVMIRLPEVYRVRADGRYSRDVYLANLAIVEADIVQSIVRVPGLGSSASMIDMIACDAKGEYLFLPHETLVGAGVSRYDIANDTSVVLFRGDTGGLSGNSANDWGAFDPSTWTTNGTLFLAEEWSGQGHVIEALNPMADPAGIEIR